MEKATAVPSANARVVQIEIRHAAVARKFLGILRKTAELFIWDSRIAAPNICCTRWLVVFSWSGAACSCLVS
jgi:hypothetical protein